MVAAGQRIGEYILDRAIGSGAFGEVWLASHHVWHNRLVAIKFALAPAYIRNLQQEGLTIPDLNHPAIVRAHNFDPYTDPPYLVMDYVAGTSLRPLIVQRALSASAAVAVLRQILDGLAHAHSQGIVHRDLKPENVLIQSDAAASQYAKNGCVKITDFGLGLAAARARNESIEMSQSIASDQARRVVGTLDYMAPEQRDGDEIDARADLYACGVMLFEMLTGKRPVGRELPSELNSDVPKHLDVVFGRAWARRENRFKSAAAFRDALDGVAEKSEPRPVSTSNPVSASRRAEYYFIAKRPNTTLIGHLKLHEVAAQLRTRQIRPEWVATASTGPCYAELIKRKGVRWLPVSELVLGATRQQN